MVTTVTGTIARGSVRAKSRTLAPAVALILLSVTFGQRIGFKFGGGAKVTDSQLPLCLLLAAVATLLIVLDDRVRVRLGRLSWYGLSMVAATASALIGKYWFSSTSYLYLVILYAPLVLVIPVDAGEYRRYLAWYQNLMVIFAAIGIVQMLAQFSGHPLPGLLDAIVPERFLMSGYNTDAALQYGSTFNRSTGEFFLEPSFLSQFCGIALVLEYLYFRNRVIVRWWRYLLYSVAIYASFAGTGMVFLLVFFVAEILRTRRYYLAIAGLSAFLILYSGLVPYSDDILGRVGEYQDENSSSYLRFILPWVILRDFPWTTLSFLFGKGAGYAETMTEYANPTYPVITKLMVEYGLICTVLFLGFIIKCFYDRPRSYLLTLCLFLIYMFLNASLLESHVVLLLYVIAMLMPEQSEDDRLLLTAGPEVRPTTVPRLGLPT